MCNSQNLFPKNKQKNKGANSLMYGVLWTLYVFVPNTCRGYNSYYWLIVIDSLFDCFYATFPLIVVTGADTFNDPNSNLTFRETIDILAGSVRSNSEFSVWCYLLVLFVCACVCVCVCLCVSNNIVCVCFDFFF